MDKAPLSKSDETLVTDVAATITQETAAPELYNFSRAGEISGHAMRAITTINDQFARNLTHTLAAWLRTQFEVKLVAGEQLLYGEFIERLPNPVYVCSIRLEPFDATGLMEIDLALASPIVDLLLGGVGRVGAMRQLSGIEEEILGAVVQKVVQELNVAWQAVGLHLTFEKRETEAQVARTMSSSEKTLCVNFEARMPETRGRINLCLPSAVLNTILRQLVAEGYRPRRRSKEARIRMGELIGEAGVGAVLQFPPLRLRARELAGLGVGSILRLPLPQHAEAEFCVGGLRIGGAYPVRTGEHRGAQLAEKSLGRNVAVTTSVN